MGNYRSEPDKNKKTISQSYQNMQFAVSHMCGWRLYMEDSAISEFNFDDENHHIFGIFDGHGGGEVAIFVKRHFIEQLQKNQNFTKNNFKAALQETYSKMDEILVKEQGKQEIKHIQKILIEQDNLPKRDEKCGAGCTALVCLFADRNIYIANAGDSKIYAKKGENLIQLNAVHSPLTEGEFQRIEHAGGKVNNQGRINGCLNVSRAIGDMQFKSNKRLPACEQQVICLPDVAIQSTEQIEYIIIGCDGVWETKTPAQIQKIIDKGIEQKRSLNQIVEEVLQEVICKQQQFEQKQCGKDNMTIILIKLQ